MAEPFIISCPSCGKQLKVSADAVGKKVRCKGCEEVFPVEDPGRIQAAAPKKKAPAGKPAPTGKTSGGKSARPDKPAAAPKEESLNRPATAAAAENEDDDRSPYLMANMDLAARCPQCATPFDPPEAVICMHCGFNTETRSMHRTRTIKETTGQDKFMWRLPGILGIVGIIAMFVYICIHHFVLPNEIYSNFDAATEALNSRSDAVKMLADPEGFAQAHGAETAGVNFPEGDFMVWIFHPAIELWLLIGALFGSFYLGRLALRRLYLTPDPPEVEMHK